MNESEMGYRGSKSSLLYSKIRLGNEGVKEQRVDGSLCINSKRMHIRYTLMDFERSYQVKILSKQLINYYSTKSVINNNKLNPFFVTGFTDAEGTFSSSIVKNKNKYRVTCYFGITLNDKDSFLILQLQEFFGGIGTISIDKKNRA